MIAHHRPGAHIPFSFESMVSPSNMSSHGGLPGGAGLEVASDVLMITPVSSDSRLPHTPPKGGLPFEEERATALWPGALFVLPPSPLFCQHAGGVAGASAPLPTASATSGHTQLRQRVLFCFSETNVALVHYHLMLRANSLGKP